LKVAIKYCGGCNPDYDRVALVRYIEKSLHGKVEFVSAKDEDIDLVLAVEGCKTARADLSAFKGTKIRIISKIEDAEEFLSIEQGAEDRSRRTDDGRQVTEGGRLRR
jgi:hypothetical protein